MSNTQANDAVGLRESYEICRHDHISRIKLLLTKKFGLQPNSTPVLITAFHHPVILTNGNVLKADAIYLNEFDSFIVICSNPQCGTFHHSAWHLSTDTLHWLHEHLHHKPCDSIL